MSTKIKSKILIIVSIASISLFSGYFLANYLKPKKEKPSYAFNGTILENARAIPKFKLTGIDKQTFNNKSLENQWTFVFFGFTSCGSMCPTTLAKLAKMLHTLESKQIKPLPKIVMISIDPQRDSLKKLRNYVHSFDPNFYGARGANQAIKKLTRELGVAYLKIHSPQSTSNADNYDIQHSGAVMLFNPEGKLKAFFVTPHKAMLIVKDYQQLIS